MSNGMPSIEVVLDRLLSEREAQLTHFEALDAKAGLLLGFSGVLIALVPDIPGAALVLGSCLAIAAAISALVVLWPRKFPVFEARRLRSYLKAEVQISQLTMVDTVVDMTITASLLLERKATWLKSGFALLLAAVVTLGIGVVVDRL
ncbi:MAG: hypothetical protein M3353_03565 [Actinomycetota bacterium]|nr:hypothetical protein [Actinomycetota bacterium]